MKTLQTDYGVVEYIDCPKEARKFVAWLKKAAPKNPFLPAIDFETTGLRPDYDNLHTGPQVRLSCISLRRDKAFIIDHFKCGSFASFADDFIDIGKWYVFNACFETRWFDAFNTRNVECYDVANMRRSVMGGGPLSLKLQALFDLHIKLDKDEQDSDWSQLELRDDQIAYAGADAIITRRLGRHWAEQMQPHHWEGFFVLNDVVRSVNEMEDTGLLLDVEYHKSLIAMWSKRRNAAFKAIRKLVPANVLENVRSKTQLSNFLKSVLDADAIANWPCTDKTRQLQTTRAIMRSMSYVSPYPFSRFLAALMVFNRADKYLSTYGETLLTKQKLSHDGRVHGRLNIAAAVTGRFSSSNPNMQNIPRSPVVRRSFIADEGRKLILADYSGIEVRVLAELSQDKILLHDCIYGDVHSQSAIAIYKQDEESFLSRIKSKDTSAKEMRSKAKGFTFQLLYGAGAAALSIVLRTDINGAEKAINSWSERYKRAYHYRQVMFEKMRHDGFLPCASGRTIFVPKQDRSMPVAANYPIQGSAGDVMYRACYHVHNRLEDSGLNCLMMVTVHDELLLLSHQDDAAKAKTLLEEGMIDGWLDIFPGTNTDHLVEAVVGDSWADKS